VARSSYLFTQRVGVRRVHPTRSDVRCRCDSLLYLPRERIKLGIADTPGEYAARLLDARPPPQSASRARDHAPGAAVPQAWAAKRGRRELITKRTEIARRAWSRISATTRRLFVLWQADVPSCCCTGIVAGLAMGGRCQEKKREHEGSGDQGICFGFPHRERGLREEFVNAAPSTLRTRLLILSEKRRFRPMFDLQPDARAGDVHNARRQATAVPRSWCRAAQRLNPQAVSTPEHGPVDGLADAGRVRAALAGCRRRAQISSSIRRQSRRVGGPTATRA